VILHDVAYPRQCVTVEGRAKQLLCKGVERLDDVTGLEHLDDVTGVGLNGRRSDEAEER
jgi:hypothetical protein